MAISSRFVLKATCLVLVALAVATPAAEGQLSCGQVTSALAPCFDYVLRGGLTVPSNCCYGVKSLYKEAATTADRQAVCYCLKAVTNSASSPVIANAASLPKKCGVILPYTISPTIDCAKVR
ncbi:non-specific lipid-transfer protein 1-like [Primulina tabacum]|uniref:non-specific lipid-transfer protein 1-like n=1 Tax=Primulina tabacum TaxID=48773 RepID=UPI003F59824D